MQPTLNRVSLDTAENNFYLSDDLIHVGLLGDRTAWQRTPLRCYPVCHRMAAAMTVRMHLGANVSSKPIYYTAHFSLQGAATFTQRGSFSVIPGREMEITFTVRIPAVLPGVYEAQLIVDWAEDGIRPLGSTGVIKFDVCLVLDTPTILPGQLSYGRLLHAFEVVKLADSDDPHQLIAAIHRRLPGYDAEANIPDPWNIAVHFEVGRGRFSNRLVVDCQSMARYLEWLLDLLGYSRHAVVRSTVVVFACPVKPHVVFEAPLDRGREPHCQNPDIPFGDVYSASSRLPMPADSPYPRARVPIDIYYSEAALLDRGSNPNNYEACFKLTYNGLTRYYPGGVGAALDDRLAVITVFARMGWRRGGAWIDHYNYANQVLTTYVVAAGDTDRSPLMSMVHRLPLIDGGVIADDRQVRHRMSQAGDFAAIR